MTPRAACGSTDPHGAHVFIVGGHPGVRSKRFCVGNVNVVRAVTAPDEEVVEQRKVREVTK